MKGCSTDGCGRQAHAKGRCAKCYAAWRRTDPEFRAVDNAKALARYHSDPTNRDKQRARQGERYRSDPEYREARKASASEAGKQWRKRNPEEQRRRTVLRSVTHPRSKAYLAAYQRANRDAVNARTHKRRAMLAGATGSHTAAEWRAVRAAYGGWCAFCGSTERLCKDHIHPLAIGGSNSVDNLRPLCRSCNSRKSKKMDETLAWLPAALLLKLARWAAGKGSG